MARAVSLTEAKAKLNELVRDAQTENVVLVRHGQPAAVVVSPEHYEALLEEIEDLRDRLALHASEPNDMNIPLDVLRSELGMVEGVRRRQEIADALERDLSGSVPDLTGRWEQRLAPSLAALHIDTPAAQVLSTLSGAVLETVLSFLQAFFEGHRTEAGSFDTQGGSDLVWIDVFKGENGWIAESSGEILTREETKAAAVRYAAQMARSSHETISVRIHKTNGQLQERRTYPSRGESQKAAAQASKR